MSSEIIQSVAYDNYDDFLTLQRHFSHKFSFHYFDETNLRVRYTTYFHGPQTYKRVNSLVLAIEFNQTNDPNPPPPQNKTNKQTNKHATQRKKT
jgi:hypothetical protein